MSELLVNREFVISHDVIFKIVHTLKSQYSVTYLCNLMSVNQSGYYKRKNRKGKRNQYEINRDLLTQLKIEINEKHKSHGYHRIISGRLHTLGFADP